MIKVNTKNGDNVRLIEMIKPLSYIIDYNSNVLKVWLTETETKAYGFNGIKVNGEDVDITVDKGF